MGAMRKRGFTLVELLVVISIIGILIALLMPAVQSGQEGGRRAQCKNNLKQLGLGVSQHLEKHGFFPTGGWGWNLAGDPDRGFTKKQYSGWAYNILPYIEQTALHDYMDYQTNKTDAKKREQGKIATATPLAMYICPTRRRAIAYPYIHSSPYTNIDNPTAIGIGRTDYAICAGDLVPGSIQGNAGEPRVVTDPNDSMYYTVNQNGISYLWSEVKAANVEDGLSNTYCIGERYLNADDYYSGKAADDDQGWNQGYDWDTVRWVPPVLTSSNAAKVAVAMPRRDRPGVSDTFPFGSAHPAGWNVVFCDGSVRTMSYSIDALTHHCLGVRNDHIPIDQSKLQQ